MKKTHLLLMAFLLFIISSCGNQTKDSSSKVNDSEIIKEAFVGDIFKAAKDGDLEVIKQALKSGIDIDKPDAYGQTMLMVAAEYGHFEVVKYLLANGADKNIENIYQQTAENNASNIEISNYINKFGEHVE